MFTRAEPGRPDSRGPGHFLWWLAVSQWPRMVLGGFWGTAWMVTLTLPPFIIAQAIDDGLRARDGSALAAWAVALVAVSVAVAVTGVMRHRTMTFVRMDAQYRTIRVVTRRAAELGTALPRKMSTGEVVTIGATDITHIGQTLTMAGPGVGAVVAYVVVAVRLFLVSPVLAAVVMLGVPAVALSIGPLLRPLQRAESSYRERQGELTARAGDIVAGLRVLSGIGGKDLFAARYRQSSQEMRERGYRVGAVVSWIQALAAGVPALFLGLVVWLAARMAAAGEITVGEMVAVYGLVAMLVIPVSSFIEAGTDLTRGRVAADRVVRMLNLTPGMDEADRPAPVEPAEAGRELAGDFVVVAAANAADAARVAVGLGRRLGDAAATRGEVRRGLLIAENEAYLFAGSLREVVDPAGAYDTEAIGAALHTAAAEDIVAGLAEGLESPLGTQARTLSGGQRQRIRLARAVLADPGVLCLLDPTSAVDAYTEGLIAERLRAARAGKATIVASTSPLFLSRATTVVFVQGGRVVATGGHSALLASEPGYRALVSRARGEGPTVPSGVSRLDEALPRPGVS